MNESDDIGKADLQIRKITFLGRSCGIILQSENGPCPIIALANALILERKIDIPPDTNSIGIEEVIQLVANAIFEVNNSQDTDGNLLEIDEVLDLLPKLVHGLDLNVIFTDVSSFEFTREISVFDALHIPLLHGWIPENDETFGDLDSLLRNKSYNYLTLRLAAYKSALIDGDHEKTVASSEGNDDLVELLKEGVAIDRFLSSTSSQLTFKGVVGLYANMSERQIAVLFRNNHFSLLFCIDGQIFSLVTDVSFLQESAVWELLDSNSLQGDSEFFDCQFQSLATAIPSPSPPPEDNESPPADLYRMQSVVDPQIISSSPTTAVTGTYAAPRVIPSSPSPHPLPHNVVKQRTASQSSATIRPGTDHPPSSNSKQCVIQ